MLSKVTQWLYLWDSLTAATLFLNISIPRMKTSCAHAHTQMPECRPMTHELEAVWLPGPLTSGSVDAQTRIIGRKIIFSMCNFICLRQRRQDCTIEIDNWNYFSVLTLPLFFFFYFMGFGSPESSFVSYKLKNSGMGIQR